MFCLKSSAKFYQLLIAALAVQFMVFFFSAASYAQSNSVFVDASVATKIVTPFGNASMSNDSFVANGVSGNFNGSGDYLTVYPNPLPGITNELTIEAWVYINSIPVYGWPIVSQTKNQGQGEQEFYVGGSGSWVGDEGKLKFLRFGAFANPINITSTASIPLKQWTHVAVTFDGSYIRLFINGVLDTSAPTNTAWEETDQPFYVAQTLVPNYPAYQIFANGKISDLRITKSARYKNSFVPHSVVPINNTQTYDPFWFKDSILLNANGPNGSTTIYDDSSSPKAFNTVGNLKISTQASVSGGAALFFDGSNSYAYSNHNDDLTLLGDFTIECWVNNSVESPSDRVILDKGGVWGYLYPHWGLSINTSGKFSAILGKNDVSRTYNVVVGTTSVETNKWYHLAFIRSGNTLKLFVNGVQEGGDVAVDITPTDDAGRGLWIGRYDRSLSSQNWGGYIDDVRITKGIARYTTTFTPSAIPPVPARIGDVMWSNVSLLLNANGSNGSTNFSDLSSASNAISVSGNAKINTAESRFGGSAIYFDGNGDYLSIPSNAAFGFGKDDYTMEMWINPSAAPAQGTSINLLDSRTSMGYAPFTTSLYGNTTGTTLGFFAGNNGAHVTTISPTIPINAWTHVAWVRHDGVVSLYVNGVKATLSEGDAAIAGSIDFGASLPLKIGIAADASSGAYNGYIDDLRITKGAARYLANFSPSSAQLEPPVFLQDPFGDQVSLLLMSKASADQSSPKVLSTSPTSSNQVLTSLDVFFSDSIDPLTFVTSNLSVKDQNQTSYTIGSMTKISATQYRINFSPALSNGQFTLTIKPQLAGLNGMLLDQNNNGIGGELQDTYNYSFSISSPASPALFTDASLNPKNINVFGDAKINAGQSKFNGIVGEFDGAGDFLSVDTNPLPGITSAFTEEAWIYMDAISANGWPIVSQSINAIGGEQQFFVSGSNGGTTNQNKLRFYRGNGVGNPIDIIGSTTLPLNQWIHVAVSANGSTVKLFVNGNEDASVNTTVGWVETALPFYIATTFNPIDPQKQSFAQGKIFDLRITKNSARYQSSFSPIPVSSVDKIQSYDPYWSNNSLLILADGVNDSTSVTDTSFVPKSLSVNNGAKISTAQSKFGGSSLFFDGYDDSISTGYSDDFDLSNADFTIDGWIYVTAYSGSSTYGTVLSKRSGGGDFDYVLFVNGYDKNLVFTYGTSASSRIDMGTRANTLPLNTWHHFAVTRKGSDIKFFLNGNLEASNTVNGPLRNRALPLDLGKSLYYSDSYFAGYIDDIRVTKGAARYSSNFVPAAIPPLPIKIGDELWSNVSLLLNGNGPNGSTKFSDSSSTSRKIIENGNAQISTAQSKYGGSSLFFNGNGDSLLVPYSEGFNLGTSDFTVEFWINLKDKNSANGNAVLNVGTSNSYWQIIVRQNAIRINTFSGSFIDYTAPVILDENIWHHVAWTRKNGVNGIYYDGHLLSATGSVPNNLGFPSSYLYVGSNYNLGTTSLSGFLDDVRITKGVARYTSDFTPPQAQFEPAYFAYDPYGNNVELLLMSETNIAPKVIGISSVTANQPLASLDVFFSAPIDSSTFTVGDISITDEHQGTHVVSAVTKINEKQYRLGFSPALTNGFFTLNIGPDIKGLSGLALDQNNNGTAGEAQDVYSNSFNVDTTPPNATLLDSYPGTTGLSAFVFSGTKEINSSVFNNGTLIVSADSKTTWTYTANLILGTNNFDFVVKDAAGNSGASTKAEIIYKLIPPGPVSLFVTPQGNGTEAGISWLTYIEALNGNNIGSYKIYYSLNPYTDINDATLYGEVSNQVKITKLQGLERNKTYYVSVVAIDRTNLFLSQVAPVQITPIDNIAPSGLANLNVVSDFNSLSLSWNPASNSDGDLASYRVSYFESGSPKTITLNQSAVGNSNPVAYQLTDLIPATAYSIRVSAVDNEGNTSTALVDPGVTLLNNPTGLKAESGSGKAQLSWNPSTPGALVKHYAVYVQSSPFTSVQGLTPVQTVAGGQIATAVTGLANGVKVYVAVTAVNTSNGEVKAVQSIAVTPQEDKDGPVIVDASYLSGNSNFSLENTPTLNASGKFVINATDISKVSRLVFTLDNEPLANVFITNSVGAYEQAIDLLALTDGPHTLTIDAFDMFENITHKSYAFAVDLAAPAAPVIISPIQGSTTNQKNISVSGTALPNTNLSLANGTTVVSDIKTNSSGKFSATIDLKEGANGLIAKAQYIGRSRWSSDSDSRTVTLNTQIPNAPTGLLAVTGKQGQVILTWNAVANSDATNQVKGYNLYRSANNFTSLSDSGVTRINTQLIGANGFTDLVVVDGNYFYAVTAINQVANESALSPVVNAVADSQGPKVNKVTYITSGKTDAQSGRMGVGTVQVTVTFNEPLRNAPYFAVVPNKGVPIAIELSKSYEDEKQYTGQFQITPSTPTGIAYAVMSAYDNAGNRGTDIDQGATLTIDTQGPDVTSLTVLPVEPLKVDAINGLAVNVALTLNDETQSSLMPKFIPLLHGAIVAGYEQGIVLSRNSGSALGAPVWTGSFNLPGTAAKNGMETLSFSYQAQDDLENVSTKINGKNQFQVYQGELPPLAVPTNLTAKALPNGKVKLTWKAVDKAFSYMLYRQGPNDAAMLPLDPVTTIDFIDQTIIDGTYSYAVVSVRNENGQESKSAKSETVTVKADRISPAAPQELKLELNGAGLVSRWLAPVVDSQGGQQAQDGLTYNLYRLALPKDQQVSTASGLTPIQTLIPALIALDTTPSTTEHSYFVTAVDAAGNESAPSSTQYLNFGLLPVNQLHIELNDNGYPKLSWQHSGLGIKDYNVYRRTDDGTPVLLTPESILHTATATTYVDTTYNGNQASKGAGQEVVYSVIARDSNKVESLAHELKLPAISVRIEKTNEVLLARGIMNKVMFRVSNNGKSDANKLRLYVSLVENGNLRVHQSDYFNVAANTNTLIPIVIGGYSKLDGLTDLTLRLEQIPQSNQSINIYEQETVQVGNSSLTANIDTQDFIRGTTGKASFTFTNTSDVETEIVLATGNGNADSNEVRFVLEDLQGNVLSQQPVKQFAGVISVASGQMVARIAPKASFTSELFNINIPGAAPDQVKLRLAVDKYHYHLGQDTHVEMAGVGVSKNIQLSDTSYYAEVDTIAPKVVYSKGETVAISGRALEQSTQQPMPNVPIALVYSVRGFERKAIVYSDATGKFVFNYKSDGATGKYRVSAVHPDVTDRPNHGEFIVEGGSVNPQELDVKIPRNYVQQIPVRIDAGYESVLNNIRLVLLASGNNQTSQLPTGITINVDSLAQINASTSAYLNLNFSGDNFATDTGLVSYRVEADNHTGTNALGTINIHYSLLQAAPAVATQPTYIDTGVGLDKQIAEDVVVTNKGLDVLRNAKVELATKDASQLPTWITLNTETLLGDLAVGDQRAVQVIAKPLAGTAEGDYEFKLLIKGDNLADYSIPIFIKVTQSGKGKAFFHVSDIYTATLDKNNQLISGVDSATIQLQNENVLSEVYSFNTDVKGEATFESIPAGRYSYRAIAFDHTSINGRIWVKPGVTTSEEVFLMNNLVNVEWSVREITIEDRYEVKLEATFKTNVPVALVMLAPLSVQLPVMKQGEVFQGEFTLTNHGLIRAENVKQLLPSGNGLVRFEFLKEIPETLEAGEVFILPYRVQALTNFNPEADAQASGGGCGSFNATYQVSYQSRCVNETVVPSQTQANFNANWGKCASGGGTTSTASAAYGYAGGNGGYGGGITYSRAGSSITEDPLWCLVKTECESCGNGPGGNGKGKGGGGGGGGGGPGNGIGM